MASKFDRSRRNIRTMKITSLPFKKIDGNFVLRDYTFGETWQIKKSKNKNKKSALIECFPTMLEIISGLEESYIEEEID